MFSVASHKGKYHVEFDVSLGEPKVMSALNGLADLYETLTDIQEPKALLTCKDCLLDLD